MKTEAAFIFFVLFGFVCTSVSADGAPGKHWALLVAGSNEYYNYRHQADICHAYHVVRSHGIPDERIIVMMYDDIAHSSENPFPGNIINEPNGPNVYPGVLKDYTGEDVTPEVFLKVLTGDEDGIKQLLGRSGKVIKSDPNDHIFVNFADHGAPGLIAFPSDTLHAEDLNKAIMKMHEEKKYKKMVLYVEACESGSMFHNILSDKINVFATTAANPDQSSYACYFDEKRHTYLGDVYSVNWMQDSDVKNLGKETLQRQFKVVKQETNTSVVKEYGDFSMKKDKVGDYQGNMSSKSLQFHTEKKYNPNADAVPSEDVQLEILKYKANNAEGEEQLRHRLAIKKLLKRRMDTRNFFKAIVQFMSNEHYDSILKKSVEFSDFKCYRGAVNLIKELCPGLKMVKNDFALRNLRALANLCETGIAKEDVWATIKMVSGESQICNVL